MSEQGKCPNCRSLNLEYGKIDDCNEEVYYPFTCFECGFRGREWHKLEFVAMTDEEGAEV